MSEQNKQHKSKIGGQALIEGVMMNGIHKGAMACRLPNGTIDVEVWDKKGTVAWYRKAPLIRGVFNFVISLKEGYRCLMKSAEKQMVEEDEENKDSAENEGNAEKEQKKDEEKSESLSEKAMSAIMGIVMVLSLVVAVGLFVFLPKWIVNFFDFLTVNRFVRSFSEGIIKILIFIGYLAFTTFMKDVRRTYEYHGAEHKTIACFEAGLELTVDNVKKQVRFHPRCGTSFIFITLFISILVMCLVPFDIVWQRMLSGIVLLPIMVGISYELIRIAGRYDNPFTRILSAPGLWIQRITTKEPDASEIECAIEAIKPCIPENIEEDIW